MLNILKYTVTSILKRPLLFFIAMLQLSATLYFFNLSFLYKEDFDSTTKKIKDITQNRSVFYLQDRSDEDTLFKVNLSTEDTYDRMSEFYKFLKSETDFGFTSCSQRSVQIKDFHRSDALLDSYHTTTIDSSIYSSLRAYYIDENYSKYFRLNIQDGRMFNKDDFEYSGSINVILGSNFRELYKIGDTLSTRLNTSKITDLKIIGFLEKESYFINFQGSIFPETFDDYIILPYNNMVEKDRTFVGELDMRIMQSYIFTDNESKTLNSIQKKSSELNLYALQLGKSTQALESFSKYSIEGIKTQTLIFILILVIGTIGILVSLINSLTMRKKEFGVHLMSGGSLNDIYLRVFCELAIIVISAYIVLFAMKTNIVALPWLILITISVMLLITTVLVLKIRNMQINLLLRREE